MSSNPYLIVVRGVITNALSPAALALMFLWLLRAVVLSRQIWSCQYSEVLQPINNKPQLAYEQLLRTLEHMPAHQATSNAGVRTGNGVRHHHRKHVRHN